MKEEVGRLGIEEAGWEKRLPPRLAVLRNGDLEALRKIVLHHPPLKDYYVLRLSTYITEILPVWCNYTFYAIYYLFYYYCYTYIIVCRQKRVPSALYTISFYRYYKHMQLISHNGIE